MKRIFQFVSFVVVAASFLHGVSPTPVEDDYNVLAAATHVDGESPAAAFTEVPSNEHSDPDLEGAEPAYTTPLAGGNVTALACDPCDDSCDSSSAKLDVRTVHGDESEPFLPGEAYRWRISGKRQVPILDFNCGSASPLPEVCQNMCYGVNCRGFTTTLTRNSVASACSQARRRNTCGNKSPNRCSSRSGFPAGYNCDEYPFASTIQGQQAGTGGRITAVTRCVPVAQNSKQGGMIASLYRTLPQGGQYTVHFNLMGGTGTGYCSTNVAARNCNVLSGSQMNT